MCGLVDCPWEKEGRDPEQIFCCFTTSFRIPLWEILAHSYMTSAKGWRSLTMPINIFPTATVEDERNSAFFCWHKGVKSTKTWRFADIPNGSPLSYLCLCGLILHDMASSDIPHREQRGPQRERGGFHKRCGVFFYWLLLLQKPEPFQWASSGEHPVRFDPNWTLNTPDWYPPWGLLRYF